MLKKFRCILAFAFIFAAAFSVYPQNQTASQWTRIKDERVDILMPPNYLVDNEIEKSFILAPVRASLPDVIDLFEKPRITGNLKSLYVNFSVFQLRQVSAAKNHLWYFTGRDNTRAQGIQSGDFTGKVITRATDKTLSTRIAVAVKARVYLVYAHAKKEDRDIYEKFLASLNLGGQQLFKSQAADASGASPTVLISNLQTSPEISAVLNQKPDKSEVKVVKTSDLTPETERDERAFSRPLIILRQPHPIYGPDSIVNKQAGVVRLKITFQANGKIGDITTASNFPDDVVDHAVKSARNIRFLPAEIDGKKVDAVKIIEYNYENP